MATRFRFYERLREHIPEEAARLIAEEMTTETDVGEKFDRILEQMATKADLEKLRSSMFRWMLTFFVPLWIATYGTLIAIVLKH